MLHKGIALANWTSSGMDAWRDVSIRLRAGFLVHGLSRAKVAMGAVVAQHQG
jgi:hypothetical protein